MVSLIVFARLVIHKKVALKIRLKISLVYYKNYADIYSELPGHFGLRHQRLSS